MSDTDPDTAADAIRRALAEAGLDHAEPEPGIFVANLPGQKRLKTACWLTVGSTALTVEAFVMRRPDENEAAVHRWLLAHNARMFGVAWSIDDSGDVYLSGRWPLQAITGESVDRLLGAVLDYADNAFNTLLELGFGGSIRREWAWRKSRGESLANLAAFEGFIRRSDGPAATAADATAGDSTAGDSTAADLTAADSSAGDSTPGDSTPGDSTPGDSTAADLTAADSSDADSTAAG